MSNNVDLKRLIFTSVLGFGMLLAIVSPDVAAQPEGGGGSTTSSAVTAPRKAPPKPAARKPVAKPPVRARAATAEIGSVDGKWWTTGNGFGDSEVVFIQNGTEVSGSIKWSDGRTGSIKGTMVGKRLQHTWTSSSGDGGTGWLELSWSNFLGGAWRNQRVRDGSWTLRRVEGKWCFGGSRNRIRSVTHDAQGRLSMVTEDGGHESGRLEGPWIYLHGEFGDIRGETDYKGNRVNWSTGFFWTWCGP